MELVGAVFMLLVIAGCVYGYRGADKAGAAFFGVVAGLAAAGFVQAVVAFGTHSS